MLEISQAENNRLLLSTRHKTFFSHFKVSDEIISYEIGRLNGYSITSERFHKLAESAHALFPTILKDTWYSNAEGPKGSLYSAYERYRAVGIHLGRIKVNKSSIGTKRPHDGETYSEELLYLMEPVQIIDTKYILEWTEKASAEKSLFYKNNPLHTIFQKFSNLRLPYGYKLISADFESFQGKKSDSFAANWSLICDKILAKAKSVQKNYPILQELLKDLETFSKEEKENTGFLTLPFCFKKIQKTTLNKKSGSVTWYPEHFEVLDNFILHLKETGSFEDLLENAITDLKQYHLDHKVPWLQNLVILHGKDIRSLNGIYVCIGKQLYQVNNVATAVNICLQSVKVFHKQHPRISSHIWQFLERKLYNYDSCTSNKVLEFIQALSDIKIL